MQTIKQALPDIRQRVIFLAFMFAVANGGLWLGNDGHWDVGRAFIAVGLLAIILWVLDPVLQLLAHKNKEEEVDPDGDVA